MTDGALLTPPQTDNETERKSYGSIVWSQLARSRLAVFGLWSISFLVLVAVYAPLICLNHPFWFSPPTGLQRDPHALPYPFFAALFDVNFFENGVDFFFNTAMVLSPFILVAWLVSRKVFGASWLRWRSRFLLAVAALQLFVFVWIWTVPNRHAYYDYAGKIAEYTSAGQQPSYLFPLYPHSFRQTHVQNSLLPPSGTHPFGTDREGRDVFARMVYGTRISLSIGIVAVAIYVVIGTILGAIAGFFGGWVDMLISRFIEIMLCFPAFFLILTLAAFIEKRSIFHIMFLIGITRWTGVARLIRGEFLRQRNLEYVYAATALGLGRLRIIFGHILPNAVAPMLVSATFGVASAIITESSLSFLGLGDASAPSWGQILSGGRIEFKMWLILVPGFAIFFVVSVFNLVGEGLRDALDPKLRQ